MKGLVYMLLRERRDRGILLVLLLVVSSVAYFLMPLLLTRMLVNESEHQLLVALFVTVSLVYSLSQNRLAVVISRLLQQGIARVLVELAERLVKLDLATVERFGVNRVSQLVSQEVGVLSSVGEVLGPMLQKLGVLLLIGVCIGVVSPAAAGVWLALLLGCLWHSWTQTERVAAATSRLSRFDSLQLEYSDGLLRGLRQVQASRRLRRGLQAAVSRHGNAVGEMERRVGDHMLMMWQGYHLAYFVGLSVYLYFFPIYSSLGSEEILGLVLLLTLTPINDIAQGVPQLLRANVSARRLYGLVYRLARILRRAGDDDDVDSRPLDWRSGDEITLSGITFGYGRESDKVVLGPVELSVRYGETLLISGTNGSGKSTLLKVLMGLYPAKSGCIRLGKKPIGGYNLARYQALFSYVSADPFLFDRLYGMKEFEDSEVHEWMERFGVPEEVIRVRNGTFSEADVALDIRKRMALVVAIMEDRPILILDEIGGNQDESFRQFIYRKVIPELKAKGKTILVASHDERFFDIADRFLTMKAGRVV